MGCACATALGLPSAVPALAHRCESLKPSDRANGERLMKLKGYVWCLGGLLTLVAGIGFGTAISQQSPPIENKGLEVKAMGTIDLAPEMPTHQLRLRSVVVEPGA